MEKRISIIKSDYDFLGLPSDSDTQRKQKKKKKETGLSLEKDSTTREQRGWINKLSALAINSDLGKFV